MNDKPISRTEAIISPDMWSSILSGGIYTALASAFFLTYDPIVAFFTRGGVANDAVFLTAFFCFFIFTTTVNAFNVRTPKINLLENISGNFGFIFVIAFIWLVQIGFSYFGGSVLRTVPLLMDEWKWIMLASLAILPFDMLRKLIVLPFLPKVRASRESIPS
jgi:magnesium-transporting ATPase (P-type)